MDLEEDLPQSENNETCCVDSQSLEQVEPVEPSLHEMTSEMEKMVANSLTGDPEDFLFNRFHRMDLHTISELKWINNEVIDSYCALLVERSRRKSHYPSLYAYDTFFYNTYEAKEYDGVRKWTKTVDIFSYDLNFIPIHLYMHWCLGVIDHRAKKICYYDSQDRKGKIVLDLLHKYICMEHEDKKGIPLDPNTYTTEEIKDIPMQENDFDCGVFILKYAEYISRNAAITFHHKYVPYFRRRIIYDLVTNKVA